jgi:predicted site-specific integrase-resolvase
MEGKFMPTARAVTVIPATTGRFAPVVVRSTEKKKAAAYARVSTDNDEQLTSFEAQMDYYTRHIRANPAWEFVKV